MKSVNGSVLAKVGLLYKSWQSQTMEYEHRG